MSETKPKPRVTSRVCSLCGLEWERHGKNPTTETCIELLLEEVRSLNAQLAVRPLARPLPYPVPYPQPYPVYPVPLPYPYLQPRWMPLTYTSGTNIPALSATTPRAITQSAS